RGRPDRHRRRRSRVLDHAPPLRGAADLSGEGARHARSGTARAAAGGGASGGRPRPRAGGGGAFAYPEEYLGARGGRRRPAAPGQAADGGGGGAGPEAPSGRLRWDRRRRDAPRPAAGAAARGGADAPGTMGEEGGGRRAATADRASRAAAWPWATSGQWADPPRPAAPVTGKAQGAIETVRPVRVKKTRMAKKPEVDVRKLKDEVAEHLKKLRWEKAAEVLAELAAAEPKDMTHRLKLGDAYRKMDQPQMAIEAYRQAAKFFSDEGQLIKAIGALKIILEIDPRNA